jgi:hypothetical protein
LLENVTVSGAFPDVGVPPATATGGPLGSLPVQRSRRTSPAPIAT